MLELRPVFAYAAGTHLKDPATAWMDSLRTHTPRRDKNTSSPVLTPSRRGPQAPNCNPLTQPALDTGLATGLPAAEGEEGAMFTDLAYGGRVIHSAVIQDVLAYMKGRMQR